MSQQPAADLGHPGALVMRGIAWLKADRPDKALADFDAAARLAPNDPAPVFNRGLVHRCAGRFAAAVADFTTAASLSQDDPDPLIQRGCVFAQLGDDVLARDDFQSALRHDPYNPEILNRLAVVLATSSDPEVRRPSQALPLARRALEFAEEVTADLRDTLAAACAACGRFEEAVRWQTRALETAPVEEHFALLRRLRYYQRGILPPTNGQF